MRLIRGLRAEMLATQRVAATIGNFDGVHLGHQYVLGELLKKSKYHNLPSVLIAFEPSAKEFFLKDEAPARLTNFREKFHLIKNSGIDQYVCLRFNPALATMSAPTFVEKVLIDYLHIRYLTVGDNFRFGRDRKGDYALLQSMAQRLDFEVEKIKPYLVNGKRVDSSSIRSFLAAGKLHDAKQLLGRTYSMSGRVVHGDKRGRTINFPTANIPIKRNRSPVNGVFAVTVLIENGLEKRGVANIGHRPTVDGTRTQLEVHIFDFSGDLYDNHLTVSFCKKIRDEKKFDSLKTLKKQIRRDAENAKDYFNATR